MGAIGAILADQADRAEILRRWRLDGGPELHARRLRFKGNARDIFYPANLGANGVHHPIIVWANGSGTTPIPATTYAYLLRHLASWGFVVIATRDGTTGTGQTVIDSANYIKARSVDSGSIFYGKLDTTKIGAMGHSQGASGAINAMLKSGGAIRTAGDLPPAAPVLVQPRQQLPADQRPGGGDERIDPLCQRLDRRADLARYAAHSARAAQLADGLLQRHPAPLLKAKGIIKGTAHNDVAGQPDLRRGRFFPAATASTAISAIRRPG